MACHLNPLLGLDQQCRLLAAGSALAVTLNAKLQTGVLCPGVHNILSSYLPCGRQDSQRWLWPLAD